MGLMDSFTQQQFPFAYDSVFDGLLVVLPELGMRVKSADKVIGRIEASAGMSLFSWGENISLIVERGAEASSIVKIESSLKVSTNLVGSHRHRGNFSKIIGALSQHLQSKS